MAGDGELWQTVKDMNVENLILTGNLSYEHSLALLKNSEIFCLPTFSEGFSTSVLEAAALKAMVVTTKTGGSPQLIKDENHGILLESMETADIVLSATLNGAADVPTMLRKTLWLTSPGTRWQKNF